MRDGKEKYQAKCQAVELIIHKRHRYDLIPISLIISDTISKTEVIGSNIYLICDYLFWLPNCDSNFNNYNLQSRNIKNIFYIIINYIYLLILNKKNAIQNC